MQQLTTLVAALSFISLAATSHFGSTQAKRRATEQGGRSKQDRRRERGEGVISTAIAVLIMTILGGIMFFAYQRTFNKSTAKVDRMVDELDQVDAKTASQANP